MSLETTEIWPECRRILKGEIPEKLFNTWILPIHSIEKQNSIKLLAPNNFVLKKVSQDYLGRIEEIVLQKNSSIDLTFSVGSRDIENVIEHKKPVVPQERLATPKVESRLNPGFTFDAFVEGKSNQLARAAAIQVSENIGRSYNPLFIYGGVGLGKTHLMQAVGNSLLSIDPGARISYVHSERFVGDMVRGLQHNTISEFKRTYRSLDALLIDDIQFFAGKERSQEEFFHTFNALLEGQKQIILTCDRYPKEVSGLEERLKSRFGWGLTVAIEPPELETSVAILMKKSNMEGVYLPE